MEKSRPLLGVVLFFVAIFGYSWHDVFSKLLVVSLPPAQIVFIRHLIFLPIAIAIVLARHRSVKALVRPSACPQWQILRCLLIAVEMICFAWVLRTLPLADAHAIFAFSPLLVIALSGFMLAERVSLRGWIAVGVGFLGVLVIIRPGFQSVTIITLAMVGNIILYSLFTVLTRKVSRRDPADISVLWQGAITLMVSGAVVPFVWTTPSREAWILLLALGAVAAFSYTLFTLALSCVEAWIPQPLFYFTFLWSIVWGVLIFHDLPDTPTMIGGAFIVASGLLGWYKSPAQTTRT